MENVIVHFLITYILINYCLLPIQLSPPKIIRRSSCYWQSSRVIHSFMSLQLLSTAIHMILNFKFLNLKHTINFWARRLIFKCKRSLIREIVKWSLTNWFFLNWTFLVAALAFMSILLRSFLILKLSLGWFDVLWYW